MAKPVEVRNPRYAGATVGQLVRALMQRPPPKAKEDKGKPKEGRKK